MDVRLSGCAIALLLAACPGPTATPDAPPEIPDAPGTPDAGACGDKSYYTAAIEDWDSSETDFHGVFGAQWTNLAAPAETASTAPNGRIELCLTRPTPAADLDLEVDLPGDYLDAYVVAQPADFVVPQNVLVARGITATRAAEVYTSAGSTFDAAAGHLLMYFPVDRVAMTLDAAPDFTLAGNDDDGDGAYTWALGDASSAGRYLLFGNIPLQGGALTITGPAGAELTVDLLPGGLTVVNWPFAFE